MSTDEPEWWWIERDGRVEIARVAFGDAYAAVQDPPQPWCAEVVGSERVVWPDEARLLLAVAPVVTARPDNPEGLDAFDPMGDPAFAADVQAYSDRLRDGQGRPRIRLLAGERSESPAEGAGGMAREQQTSGSGFQPSLLD